MTLLLPFVCPSATGRAFFCLKRLRDALQSGRYLAHVRADQAQAKAYGIQGVPFFVIDGKYGVSGAQPADAFAQIARQVWAEKQTAPQQA